MIKATNFGLSIFIEDGFSFSIDGVPQDSPPLKVSTAEVKVETNTGNVNGKSESKNTENGDGSDETHNAASGSSSSSIEYEKLAIENIMAGPYGSHQAFVEELEELEDDYKNQVKMIPVTTTTRAGTYSGVHLSGSLEELEATDLMAHHFSTGLVLPLQYSRSQLSCNDKSNIHLVT